MLKAILTPFPPHPMRPPRRQDPWWQLNASSRLLISCSLCFFACDLVIEMVPFAYVRYLSLQSRINFGTIYAWCMITCFLGWTDFRFGARLCYQDVAKRRPILHLYFSYTD